MTKDDVLTDITYPTRHIAEARQNGRNAAMDVINGTFSEEWARSFVSTMLKQDRVLRDAAIQHGRDWENFLLFFAGYILSQVPKANS